MLAAGPESVGPVSVGEVRKLPVRVVWVVRAEGETSTLLGVVRRLGEAARSLSFRRHELSLANREAPSAGAPKTELKLKLLRVDVDASSGDGAAAPSLELLKSVKLPLICFVAEGLRTAARMEALVMMAVSRGAGKAGQSYTWMIARRQGAMG